MGNFRDRASRKEERAHFGLACRRSRCVFPRRFLFLRSFHESGGLMILFDGLALTFFVFGALSAYLALAVAMRWPPHHPKKLDLELVVKVESEIISSGAYRVSGVGNLHEIRLVYAGR